MIKLLKMLLILLTMLLIANIVSVYSNKPEKSVIEKLERVIENEKTS